MNKTEAGTPHPPVRIGLIGGFLGAGKTTAILAIGEKIVSEYTKNVAVITNDQGEVLVDTKIVRDLGFSSAEVVGGCFCCRFPDFITAVNEVLTKGNPDIILAEPVGSCADLPATVCEPLKRYYRGKFILAPFIVLVDPYRVQALMKGQDNESINFLLFHQIQEAEIVGINKIDTISSEEIEKIEQFLRNINERAHIYRISAKEGTGIDELVNLIMEGEYKSYSYPQIDYKTYATAEAELGWFNSSCVITAQELDIEQVIRDFLTVTSIKVKEKGGEIAHLKIHFENEEGFLKASLVSPDDDVSFTGTTPKLVHCGNLSINARIRLTPSAVAQCVGEAFEEIKNRYRIESAQWNEQCFSPPPPEPYHRILVGDVSTE